MTTQMKRRLDGSVVSYDAMPIRGYGLCRCGCGRQTRVATDADVRRLGYVLGEPLQFLHGHNNHDVAIPDPVERFWSLVNKTETCWLWVGGSRAVFGYGLFRWRGRRVQVRAHRLSWELANGPIPDGLQVLHRCDNPPCVNPAHLFLGNHMDNMRDAAQKGRMERGTQRHTAKLIPDRVREIRALVSEGHSQSRLATRFGVCQPTICKIVRGKVWGWVA